MHQVRLSHVSEQRRCFIRRCQDIGFGKIVRLAVRNTEPVFEQQTEVFVDLKLDADHDGTTPERQLIDFVLSAEITRLFSAFDRIRDGVVEHVEVRFGIPRRVVYKSPTLLQE